MKTARLTLLIVAGAAVALTSGQILADQDVRHVERDIPVPATVSPATQAVIARPLSPIWNEHPKSAEDWKVLIARVADNVVATLPEIRQRLGVNVEPTVISASHSSLRPPGIFNVQCDSVSCRTSMERTLSNNFETFVRSRQKL